MSRAQDTYLLIVQGQRANRPQMLQLFLDNVQDEIRDSSILTDALHEGGEKSLTSEMEKRDDRATGLVGKRPRDFLQ